MRTSASEEFRPGATGRLTLRQTSLEALPVAAQTSSRLVPQVSGQLCGSAGTEPTTRPPRRPTSVEALPGASLAVPMGPPRGPRLLASPLRGSPLRAAVQVSAQPVRLPPQVVCAPVQVLPVIQTPRGPCTENRGRSCGGMLRSESQSRALERPTAPTGFVAASPQRGPFSHLAPAARVPLTPHAPPPTASRSWQPASEATHASPQVWPNKEQQEQIARLTRQVQELKEQQLRHKQVAIPAAALASPAEPVTKMKPVESSPFERLLVDLPTACRNKARASGVSEVTLASPRPSINSISASAQKLREAVGAFGLPAPPTPSVKGVEDSSRHSFVSALRRSLSPERPTSPGTSPEPLSFILQPNSPARGGFAEAGRLAVAGAPPAAATTTPPSPPRDSSACGSTRLRLAERLDQASASLPGSLTTAAGPSTPILGEGAEADAVRPQPWSMPAPGVAKAVSTDAGHSSSPSSATSLKLESTASSAFEGVGRESRPTGPSSHLSQLAAEVTAKQLAELRSFRHPPAVVCQVLEAVAVILGVADARWPNMRKLLDSNLLGRLSALHPADLTSAQTERLQMLLQVPTFSESLEERCPAVAALARWCNAVGAAASGGGGEERPDLGGLAVEPDLWQLGEDRLAAVHDLTVTRAGVGCVTFHGFTDCRELVFCLPDVVVLNPGEVVIYPNQKVKPPVGAGLNKPSSIKLYGCLPKTLVFKDEKAREKYRNRVKTMTEEKGAEFLDYDCDHGIWQFRVAHF